MQDKSKAEKHFYTLTRNAINYTQRSKIAKAHRDFLCLHNAWENILDDLS